MPQLWLYSVHLPHTALYMHFIQYIFCRKHVLLHSGRFGEINLDPSQTTRGRSGRAASQAASKKLATTAEMSDEDEDADEGDDDYILDRWGDFDTVQTQAMLSW